MVYLKKIKEKMGPVTELSVSSFIDRHRYAEGYLRRLLLIGLRLNAVQYKQAQKIIEFTFLNTPALIEKLFDLISHQTFIFKEAKTKYPDFAISAGLFLKFTSPYRNWLVHGVYDTVHDRVHYRFVKACPRENRAWDDIPRLSFPRSLE